MYKEKILNILDFLCCRFLELLFDFYRETPTEQIFYHCGSKAHLSDRKIEEREIPERHKSTVEFFFCCCCWNERPALYLFSLRFGEFCNLFGLNAIANRFLDLLKRKWEKVKKITALLACASLEKYTLLQNSKKCNKLIFVVRGRY